MPLFRKIENEELGRKTFDKFLDIIKTFTDLLTQENIKEFTMEDFFGGFFQLFYCIPLKLFTKNTVDYLIEIRVKLLEDSAFFINLMYTSDIWINLGMIKEIYPQDSRYYLNLFGIDKLVHIIRHLAQSKKGPCCELHRDINDKRFARKSSVYLEPTQISKYILPILDIIKRILIDNIKEKHISKQI